MTSVNEENPSLEQTFSQIGCGRFQIILVFLCGILQSFDAMELLILAFLGQILSCEWKISVFEQSFLTTSVFIGAMFGGIIFGNLSDRYGRKSILVISSCFLIYTSMLSAFCPTIEWLILFRTLIGLSLGGIMVSLSSLASELMPIENRGPALMIILGFWPLGSYFLTTLSMITVPYYGWRVFLFLSMIPLLITMPLFIWIPESPRFFLLNNRKSEALLVMNEISKINKSEPIVNIKSISKSSENPSYPITDLFHPNYFFTTVMVNILWAVSGVSYYSIIMLIPLIHQIPHRCLQNFIMVLTHNNLTNKLDDTSCCIPMGWKSYYEIYISTTGELIFLILAIIMIKFLSRKLIMAILCAITALSFILLNLCMSKQLMSILLLIVRGSVFSMFNINYIYTSEVFPTSVRSLALGICNVSARVGSILSPFIVNLLISKYSFNFGTIFLAGLNIMSFILVIVLPYETKNRKLFQTVYLNENDEQ